MAMKILGDTLIQQRTISVIVGYDAEGKVRELVMRPVKFGKLMELERELPIPMAPSTGVKKLDPKSKQPVRRNGQYVMVRDEEDATHLEAVELRNIALKVSTVVASLGDQLTDLRPRSEDERAQDYWLAIFDDLLDAGIDQGIFRSLAQAADELSEPMSNMELAIMRVALGTDKETPEVTDEKVMESIEAQQKAEAQGKA